MLIADSTQLQDVNPDAANTVRGLQSLVDQAKNHLMEVAYTGEEKTILETFGHPQRN